MPYPDDLLEQATHLARREPRRPRQASLRRAVSTAYYALFHLLISEATLNWKRSVQRPVMTRLFEHGKMKSASEKQFAACKRIMNSKPPLVDGPEFHCIRHLIKVSEVFILAQHLRHSADYDNAKIWRRTEVLSVIDDVTDAFQSWLEIRDEPIAQDYLLSLLGNPKTN